jgi:hypothetical protein
VYTIAGSGNLTLAASTTNDTSLLAGGVGTAYTKSLSGSVDLTAGGRYVYGFLVVTSATAPTLCGVVLGSGEASTTPRLSGLVASQSDLPSSISSGCVTASGAVPYMVGT